jgi:DNA-binding transcriptional LysR family regulator
MKVSGIEYRAEIFREVDLVSGEADFVLSVGGYTPHREDNWKEKLWDDELVALQVRTLSGQCNSCAV